MTVAMSFGVLLAVPVLLFAYFLGLIWATRPDRETRELFEVPLFAR